jgi:photosystem II stability/assembly factor-like uncharacterized protein
MTQKLTNYSRFLSQLAVCWLLVQATFAQTVDMDKFKGMKPRHIGTAGMSGRVTAIAVVNDNPQTMYVGSASGGLWKSENAGLSWFPIFDDQKVSSIGSVAVQQSNPDVVWVGTGEGNPRNSLNSGYGIYKSFDAGKTWKSMGLEKTFNIHRIIIHPQNPDIVYVAAIGSPWADHAERGVYKTTNGGQTWEKVLYVNEKTGAAEMVIDPQNPNKLLVNMWEHRREPWFFKSGGEGSGLYMTVDGGKTWQKQSAAKNNLPEGELGRMGLAFSQSNPKVVYALIESKKNALYRSEDGGYQWKMISDKGDIGDRPFYYAEIYVDPKNENRIYTLYSRVGVSEDGGKSFRQLLDYETIHPDHHAWWIHPTNPNFIIDGNDGGMAITYDMGKTWRFVENLPLGQFYHINVDNATPYNVYGGMQDNGSWQMPGYVWRNGGIRNHQVESLLFGDGFDVVPDPTDNRYGYAMSQGGNLARYDIKTGDAKFIKPVHPEGKPLRFNWNAAIAQDLFNPNTIYYGSQYVHKSNDKGNTWEIISPDLTTNNPAKQKQGESGGLTYDVTFAENHTTILAIAQSPLKAEVLWAGTDDGNLQVTKDGGKTWTNVIKNIKGIPENCWIPQITASTYSEGEAFVVLNNYRRGDLAPYIFQTKDFGVTWKRLIDEKKVWGFALSFVQDFVEPKLLFAGLETGLYVSFDGGDTWNKWKQGYPTVPTMDMKIHPKEHDLVVGTFGRAAYIFDDIRPLREIAKQGTPILQQELNLFDIPDAYLVNFSQPNVLFSGKDTYQGDNRPFGAMFTYSVKAGKKDKGQAKEDKATDKTATATKDVKEVKDTKAIVYSDSAKIEILDKTNRIIRTFMHQPDSGLNRVQWDFSQRGVRFPSAPKPRPNAPEPVGFSVLPDTYKVRISYKGAKDSAMVVVKADPRITVSETALQANVTLQQRWQKDVTLLTTTVDRLKEMKETIELVSKQLGNDTEEKKKVNEKGKVLLDSIKTLIEQVNQKEGIQGIFRSTSVLSAKVGSIGGYLGTVYDMPTNTPTLLLTQVETEIKQYMNRVNAFTEKHFADFRKDVEAAKFTVFKEYGVLKE